MGVGGGGGGRGASDVRAGGAWYELYAKDGISGVLDKLKHKTERFAHSMRHVGGLLMGGGLALGAAPFASLLEGVEKLSQIKELTEMFGLSAEGASKMAYAFNTAGIESGDLEKAFKELAKSNTTGKPLDEYMLDVADGLNAIEDPSERARKAMDLLGRQGLNFLRITEKLRDLNKEAPLFSQSDLNNAKKISEEWNKIKYAFATAMVPVFEFLAPIIKLVAEFARENAGLLIVVGGLAVGLTALGVTFFTVGTLITGAIAIISAIGVVVGAILTPVGLLAAGIVALGMVIASNVKDWQSLGIVFEMTWKGIGDSIRKGDLKLAFEILSTGITIIWYDMLDKMGKSFAEWIDKNQDRIVKLAAMLGAVKGGLVGARFGPWGALAGAAGGGAAAGFGADALADELKKLGDPAFVGKIAWEKARLAGLVAAAARGPFEPEKHRAAFMSAAEAVRGQFGGGRAQQALGYGEKAGLKLLENIHDGKGGLPDAIAAAMVTAMTVR